MNASSRACVPISEPFRQIARLRYEYWLWCDSRHERHSGPPSKHTFRPTLESLGVSMNASNSTCGPTNEPFRHTPLPPRLRCEFRLGRERYIGRWLVAKRPSTLAEEFCAMRGIVIDVLQDIGHRASYAHRSRNHSASGTAGIHKLRHHGFQIAKRMLQGDGMGVGFLCLALRLLRLRVSKFSSKLGNPRLLRGNRPRKSGDAVLDLTYSAVRLGEPLLVDPRN